MVDGVSTALGGAGALPMLTVADQACDCPGCGADFPNASAEGPLGREYMSFQRGLLTMVLGSGGSPC